MKMRIDFYRFLYCLIVCYVVPFSLSATTSTYPDDWQIAHYGEIFLQHLDYKGYITLDGTTVQNSAHIDGYTHIRFSNLNQLFVKGHLMIEDSTVKQKTEIDGDMLAINVQFQGDVVCKSPKIEFRHCRCPNLIIRKLDEQAEQIIQLSETCEIFGKIIFESGKGKVIATKDSAPRRVEGGILEISQKQN